MMGFFHNKKTRRTGRRRNAAQIASRENSLLSRISELEQFIEEAPARIRHEMEEELITMPPPDDLQDRRREHKFYAQLSRGEIRNERRYQTHGAVLFVLLVTAIAALSSWIYSVLHTV